MNERYKKLYALTENLYAEGSPVIISAGALLLDTKTKEVLAQLKFKSISKKIIVALKAEITPYDDAGRVLGEPLVYKYLDLNAEIATEFGSKTPVALPDATARKISVKVIEVIFKDASYCNSFGSEWNMLLAPRNLADALGADMAKEFELKYGSKCIFEACRHYDLWYCTCGAVNKTEDNVCHVCRSKLSVLENVDLDALRDRCEKRLEAEKQKHEKKRLEAEEAQRKETERLQAKRKKVKRLCIITGTIATVILAFILILTLWVIPNSRYRAALKEMDKGNYSIAINKLTDLNGYRDSEVFIDEIYYQKALELMEQGNHSDALSSLNALMDYKDSKKLSLECEQIIFDKAMETPLNLIADGKNKQAYEAIRELSGTYDVSEYLERFLIRPSVGKTYDKYHDLHATYYYKYDDRGNMIESKRVSNVGIPSTDIYTYEYDGENRCIKENYGSHYYIKKYNNKSLCIRDDLYYNNNDKLQGYYSYEYDDNGHCIKKIWHKVSGEKIRYDLITNNEKGQAIKIESYTVINNNDETEAVTDRWDGRYNYEYDEMGNEIKSVHLDLSYDEWVYTTEYSDYLYFYNPYA